MIDGVKSWNAMTDIETDQPIEFKGLRISRNKIGTFVLRGSLHRYHNKGEHNANDYRLSDFKETLSSIYNEIGLNADVTPVNGLEFGVNIVIPQNPKNVLKRLILHKSSAWEVLSGYRAKAYNDYTVKIYDKSSATKTEPFCSMSIIRIEVAVSKMRHLKKQLGANIMLSDLMSVEVWQKLEDVLLKTIEECLIIDFSPEEVGRLTEKQKNEYLSYINPLHWIELRERENRVKYQREREKCERFISTCSTSTLKTDLLRLVRTKCEELRDISTSLNDSKSVTNSPFFETALEQNVVTGKDAKCYKFTTRIKGENVTSNTSPKGVKLCKGCGSPIESKNPRQFYCSAKVVGEKKAHQCRNKNSNPRRAIKKILSIPLLFDLSESLENREQYFTPPSKQHQNETN